MATTIKAAVKLKAQVFAGVEQQDDILNIFLAFNRKVLFAKPGPETTRLRNELVMLMKLKYFPLAEEAGANSAVPILDAVGGAEAVAAGASPSGVNRRFLSNYRTANTQWFAQEVNSGTMALSGELQAEIARASRDGIAQATMRTNVIDAYEAELKALKIKRKALAEANKGLARAEATANKAAIKAADKVRKSAQAGVRRVSTAMGRLENKVQGAARDAVRRQAQRSELASFREAGFRTFTWVTVNGSLGCPDCISLHGETRSIQLWHGNQPGDGHTVCLDSCICELVPNTLVLDNPSLNGPINPFLESELTP